MLLAWQRCPSPCKHRERDPSLPAAPPLVLWVGGHWRSRFSLEETGVMQLLGCLKMQSVASLGCQDCLGWLGTSLLNFGPISSSPFQKNLVWVLLCIHRQPDILGKSPSLAAPGGSALPSRVRHGTSSLAVLGWGWRLPANAEMALGRGVSEPPAPSVLANGSPAPAAVQTQPGGCWCWGAASLSVCLSHPPGRCGDAVAVKQQWEKALQTSASRKATGVTALAGLGPRWATPGDLHCPRDGSRRLGDPAVVQEQPKGWDEGAGSRGAAAPCLCALPASACSSHQPAGTGTGTAEPPPADPQEGWRG